MVADDKNAEMVLRSEIIAERISSPAELPTLLLTSKESIPELVRRLVGMGIDIEEITPEKPSLEKEFLTLFR